MYYVNGETIPFKRGHIFTHRRFHTAVLINTKRTAVPRGEGINKKNSEVM